MAHWKPGMAWLGDGNVGAGDDPPTGHSRFLDGWCRPDMTLPDFANELGRFTPCFTDVAVLGTAEAFTIAVCLVLLARTLSGPGARRRHPMHRLTGLAARVQALAAAAAGVGLLVPLLQLSGRLGASVAGGERGLAPYEWAGFVLSTGRWLALLALLLRELQGGGHVVLPGRWALRLALVVGASAEVVKARFVLLEGAQSDDPPETPRDAYFVYLYGTYLAVQLLLAALALVWRPGKAQGLVAAEADEEGGYLPLATADEGPADPRVGHHLPCPEASAGLLSYFTFSWMSPLIKKGYRSPLTTDDVWALPPGDKVETLYGTFERLWQAEVSGRGAGSARLGAVCWRLTAPEFAVALPYKLLNDASQFVGPMFLNLLLQILAQGGPAWRGYACAGLMFVGSVVGVLTDNQHFQRVMRAGFRLKAVLAAAVHRQVFLLTPGARAAFSSGRVYSLVASDVEALQALCQNVMGLVSSPLRIIVAMSLLFQQLGLASLTAVVVLLLLVPANAALVAASNKALKAALGHTDERTKLEAEMMAGMEVVKCSAWEEPLQERIEAARRRELAMLWRVSVMSSIVTFLLLGVPVIIPVITFGVFLAGGHTLDAAKAFTCLVLFNVLRFPLFQLPQLVAQLSAARVSLGRLRDFLAAPAAEAPPPAPAAAPGETAVRLVGDFGWDPRAPPCLVDLDLDIKAGHLVAIVGSTGSGKSTLINAVLGQAQQVFGPPPRVAGRLAYVPQAPFIVNATVRDNILFGLPYDAARYAAALHGACLADDLRALPGGDMTEMGDRGVNVSGGQKQRIAIARALYGSGDVVLLDDPLSALDARVGRRVFDRGVRSLLAAGRTVLLATNQLQYVRQADAVLYLAGGRVVESGSPGALMVAGGPFAALMREVVEEDDEEGKGGGAAPNGEAAEGGEGVAKPAAAAGTVALVSAGGGGGDAASAPPAAAPASGQAVARITQDESSGEGVMVAATLGSYLAAMPMPGGAAAAAVWLMAGFVVAEALRVGTTVWLAQWTGSTDSGGSSGGGALWYLGVYAAISGVQLLVQAANTLDVQRLGLGAAQKLHSRLLTRLLGAPMAFFHTTPLGRIINRLTKDTSDIDRNLAPMAAMAARSALQLGSTLALVGAVAPFALPALVVILAAFYWLYQYFQASVRQVKRLDAVARSPVMSSLSEALSGTATFIAYGAQPRAVARHASLLDAVSCMSLLNQSMNRWLSVRLEILGAAAALLAGVVAVEQRSSAGAAGLVMSYALQVTAAVSITVRTASMAENMLNAVERVSEYCELPQEGVAASPGAKPPAPPPAGWPPAGAVEFREVFLRYRPGLPLVLRGVSFVAQARDKVGVVGRTGAGKSSLLGCLFRLVEVERGAVLIDGVDLAKLPLRALRAKLSLIPQVPVLFTGSIRTNLSPFGLHSDAELWGALRRSHLAPLVEGWPEGLDAELAEGGAPLSAGQKQLLALARALLKPARVLVLDEATANVDVETDALIQSTLRSEFPDRTLLTIAHRLATIIDYTRVLLLDAGKVVEYDTPAALLALPGSSFGSLVDESGEAASRVLRSLAAGKGSLVQDMLQAPAKAALARMASTRQPSLQRQMTMGSGGGGGGGLLRAPTRGRNGGGEGDGEGGEAGAPPPAAAALLSGGETVPELAALVAGRSCAVARMVREIQREMERAAAAAAYDNSGGSVGAAIDDVGMVLAAGGRHRDDGGGGGGAASAAAARAALARCVALLEEARTAAAALARGWTAPPPAGGGEAGGGGGAP